jgi:hypothetical protein
MMNDELVDKIAELCEVALVRMVIQKEITRKMVIYIPAGRSRKGKD